MRFRLGLIIGFSSGYYLGAKAGRDRYRQLKGWIDEVKSSEAVETAAEKARAVVDLGVERARDIVEQKTGDDAAPPPFPGAAAGTSGMTMPTVEVSTTGNGAG